MVLEIIQGFLIGVPAELIVLVEIGLMIIIASFFAYFVRMLKQPLIPAYILTGIIISVVGPLFLGIYENEHLILSLSQIGVAFLIFTAGLEIKFSKLKEVGKVASVGGLVQVLVLFLIGLIIALILGFTGQAPVYIGLVVAFSSTMIVVKLLAERRELNSLHGRIIIGMLLVQDIIAIIALTILLSDSSVNGIIISFVKAILFILLAYILSKSVNRISNTSAKNQELLLLVSISFLFLFSIGAILAGLSIIIGAFFAGVALANSDYKTEIEGKIAPLRDFFSVIFFVTLGMQLALISKEYIILLLSLLFLVVVLKPIIIMFLIRLFGYKKITSFYTGNSLAQTSEFSLIIVTAGFTFGQISQGLFSTLVLLTIITMSLTTYMMLHQRKLIKYLAWPLNILEEYHTKKEQLEYHRKDGKRVIVFGCHRMGSLFLQKFEKEKKEIMVVDYDPEIIKSLISKKIPCIYGDVSNDEVLEKVNIRRAEMIISTVPDYEDNLMLLKKARSVNKKALIFIVGTRISEAKKLYEYGADYVILPHVIGGIEGVELISKLRNNKKDISKIKKEHIKFLDSIHHILY